MRCIDMIKHTMRNFTMVTLLLLCSLCWICVSLSESQTVEVQSGEEVTLLCSNFSSSPTQIIWFRVVRRSQPHCVSFMYKPREPASLCDGFQNGNFEMSSNISTVFLKIKQVNSSDSGLYFCGYYIGKKPLIVDATYLEVQAASEEQNLRQHETLGSDGLKDAALSLYLPTVRNRRPASQREVETHVIYAARR
ncbi:uncharacterized protein LOC125884485 isoform X7 [Epinephelus fuscoguttatus]|uniref:uncharacterized protein LOC125884485 isoform X7 n=1 Tax=Epinephelus fuscoguttatus TaxID=293821 RepID=UPI0020D0781D|nr:uncharacterized protein LOC125884485 isoform X7 [Epinephelus fuscoguttatus]